MALTIDRLAHLTVTLTASNTALTHELRQHERAAQEREVAIRAREGRIRELGREVERLRRRVGELESVVGDGICGIVIHNNDHMAL